MKSITCWKFGLPNEEIEIVVNGIPSITNSHYDQIKRKEIYWKELFQ
jgi:hypothetical protein